MSQHLFAAETAPSLVQLDANFTTLFNIIGTGSVLATGLIQNVSLGVTTNLAVDAGGVYLEVLGANPFRIFVNGAESYRVDTGQRLLVGYTSSSGAYKLQVNSQIFATSSTVATSDARYKDAVAPIDGALALVSALRPVSFVWKKHAVHDFPAGRHAGFLAQEVAQALAGSGLDETIVKRNSTQLPDGTVEDFLGLAEGNLIPILTRAIQELAARVAVLEGR